MAVITEVTKQKKGSRVNIFVDGVFRFGISTKLWVESKYKEGMEITEEEIEELIFCDQRDVLLGKAMYFLKFRPRSEQEVRDKLGEVCLKKNFCKEVIEEVMKWLKEKDYVDDMVFAKWWIEERRRRLKGIYVIKQELIKKGIGRSVISECLKEDRDSTERALDLLRRRGRRIQYKSDMERRAKLYKLLYRNGFTSEDINEALNVFLDGK